MRSAMLSTCELGFLLVLRKMNNDITIKIEEPIGYKIDIKNEFGGLGEEEGPNEDAKDGKQSDDSDH